MPGELFYWIFNMSIIASVTGLVVVLVRSIRRIPRRITVFLWLVPFLRMWLPMGLTSKYSLLSLISQFTTKNVVVYQPYDDRALTMTNSIMAANSYFPITYKITILDKVFFVSFLIWIAFALAFIIAFGIVYSATLHEMKDAVCLRDNVYLSEKIQSPAVYGVLRPKIILPFSYRNRNLNYILLHEEMHIHRGDNLWRVLAFLTVSIHWFNPLVWLFLKLFLTDLELACDERVLARCNDDQAKEYALSLLESAKSKNVFASAYGGAKIRIRIENILSYKRLTWISIIGFVMLIMAITYVLLTNAGL